MARIIDSNKTNEDDDISLRPLRLSDYIGQAGWLLRSPHNDKNMSCVGYSGYGGYGEIDYTIFGVLPAIQIKL